ncbi:MAG: fructose PTS transporter subunit IIA [Alkaliphilus sp.]|nr:fructose PTS transporter subunit IIA [Alkaliphilus sp.]
MKITDMLNEKLMNLDLKANDKAGVINEMIDMLVYEGFVLSKKAILKAVMDREAIASTGVGMGIGIPHGKSNTVVKPSIVFGKSIKGIDFESLDEQPSYIFFLIAVPEDSANEHLKALSQLSRRLMNQEVREQLMKAESTEEVYKVFI